MSSLQVLLDSISPFRVCFYFSLGFFTLSIFLATCRESWVTVMALLLSENYPSVQSRQMEGVWFGHRCYARLNVFPVVSLYSRSVEEDGTSELPYRTSVVSNPLNSQLSRISFCGPCISDSCWLTPIYDICKLDSSFFVSVVGMRP